MINKPKTLKLRYSDISNSLPTNKTSNLHSLIQIRGTKNDFNKTLTKYKSIREIKKQQQQQRFAKNRRKIYQYERQSLQKKLNQEDSLKTSDVIQIIKLKLHEKQANTERTNLTVKTEYTMNRNELKNYIKKKKTFDFINNKSLELIKSFFPKKLDLIINQLKTRKTQEHEKSISNEIIVDFKNRPNTACNLGAKPYHINSKNRYKTIQDQRPELKIRNTHTVDYQIKEVSGWQTSQLEQQLVFGGGEFIKKKSTSRSKRKR